MESTVFLVMPLALMFELEMNEESTLEVVLERMKEYPSEKDGSWIELYQSSTGQLRVGSGRVAFKVNGDETLSFYSCGEQGYKRFNGWNKPAVYVSISQHYYSSFRIKNNQTTYDELLEQHLNNDHKSGGYDLKIIQANETPDADWGHLVYKVDDSGVLQMVNSNVDSSG